LYFLLCDSRPLYFPCLIQFFECAFIQNAEERFIGVVKGESSHDGKECVCPCPFSVCCNQSAAHLTNGCRLLTFTLMLNRNLLCTEMLSRCPTYDQLWSEKHISHRSQPPSDNQSFTICCSRNIGMYCNPAAGEECSEATPDDAPYGSVVKVLVPESRE